MTALFGWDASHYDGTLTTAILAQAKAEGITFFTHKLGEAIGNVDPTAATALAAGRDVGIEFLGGYWFNHGNDRPADEVDAFLAEANRDEPWWKDFPGWFWQADLERSAAGLPSPAWAAEFCDRMLQRTGRLVVAYASRGQYGDTLAGLKHPLWNAAYPSSRQAPFKDLYPGDGGSGWTKYSGQVPVFWQYTSSATIAGRTTCDANAFRGDIAGLRALITGSTTSGDTGVSMTTLDSGDIALLKSQFAPALVEAILSAQIFVRPAGEQSDTGLSLAWATRGAYLRAGAAANTELPALAASVQTLLTDEAADAQALGKLASAIADLPGAGPGGTLTINDVVDAMTQVIQREQITVTVAPPAAGA